MDFDRKKKLVFLQIRRHVGEINWILPLIFILKKKGYKIISYFDSDETFNRLKKNKELFAIWKKINTEFFLQKKTDKIFYKIIFKIILSISKVFKLNIENVLFFKILKKKIYSFDKISRYYNLENFKFFFISDNNYSNLYLNFKEKNSKIKIIRFPHSQYIKFFFKNKFKKPYKQIQIGDIYLFRTLNDAIDIFGKNKINSPFIKNILVCGNLMYEKWWLDKVFKKKIEKRNNFQIVVATRYWDKGYFSKDSFKYIILSIMKLTSIFKNIKIIFKVHPAEKEKNYLLELLNKFHRNKWSIEDGHLVNIVKSCDLGITLNTTACLDIVSMKKPCIEFWLNNKDINYNQMFKINGKYQTNFQIQKIVNNVNNFKELSRFVKLLRNKVYANKIVRIQYSNFIKANNNKINLDQLYKKINETISTRNI